MVGEHRALGAARGAGGVNQGGQVIALALGDFKAGLGGVHGLHEASISFAQGQLSQTGTLAIQDWAGRIPHEHLRLRIGKEVRHFGSGVGRVERHIDAADLERCEVEGHRLGRLAHLGQDPLARPDASLNKHRGQARGSLGQIGVGPQCPIDHAQGRSIPMGREDGLQIGGEVAVHWANGRDLISGSPGLR